MIKTREFPESNYRGIWYRGKTLRIALDPKKPITELEYPEFYDVKITGKCEGECPWCYMDSKKEDKHFTNIVEKVNNYFGPMSINERPFQVACGGGNPNEHPDFIEVLEAFKDLGIEPNYTTNGMGLTDDILNATKKYCGGVAVSCHPHLEYHWKKAAWQLSDHGVRLNFHNIISDRKSIDDFKNIYDKWKDVVEYFVLLPYGNQGRAPDKEINWEYLLTKLPENTSQIAFGANFYPYLLAGGHNIKV
ncbi:MAG: radical SAM protein, partial [candidate division Zixibacteria bacterium]|nr:radical SAM protein [candidate division Zixibacteria bacterium]